MLATNAAIGNEIRGFAGHAGPASGSDAVAVLPPSARTSSRSRSARGSRWATALVAGAFATLGLASPAAATLTLTPLTWDIIGLDSNRPLTAGPELFPAGARVCSDVPTTNVQVDFVWPDGNGSGWDFGSGDPYINLRPGSLTSITFPTIGAGECFDAYFEVRITRSAAAFDQSREYTIVADDGVVSATTPSPRLLYIEDLVSQSRNTTTQIRYGQLPDQSDWTALGYGGSINLAIGNEYYIELTTETVTAYEQLESFLTLSKTIFQILEVSTTYGTVTAPPSRIPTPNPSLYADGCDWEPDPNSPNYSSCLATGKAGHTVVTTYRIRIISGGGDTVTLEALIYDFSGSSFHYNADFSTPQGDLITYDPSDSSFAKRFVPETIGPGGTSRLRFTITNPNPVAISGYNFLDELPAGVLVATPSNATTTCGGTVTAVPGTDEIALAGGTVSAGGSCSVLVDVTAAIAGVYNNVSGNLFIGEADTGNNATATLTVTSSPPPVEVCDENATLALWDFPLAASATAPAPTSNLVTATAGIGAGMSGVTTIDSANTSGVGTGSWEADNIDNSGSLNTANNEYFEFVIDTTGLDSITLDFFARRTTQGAQNLRLYYGPGGTETASTIYSVTTTFAAKGPTLLSTGLNSSGNTRFRLYAYNSALSNNAHSVMLDGVQFTGLSCDEITPPPPTPGVNPPTVSKSFSPDPIGAGQTSTLTFTITNPNLATALTGIALRDEMPFGVTVVPATFGGTCTGFWSTDPGDSSVLLHSGGSLAGGGSCALTVGVTGSAIGTALNISDPIYATESGYNTSLTTGIAQDSLTVIDSPSIAKEFVPNLVLLGVTPNDASTLTFTITNPNSGNAISGVSFTDSLPAGLQVAPVPNATTSGCGAPTWAPAAAATSLSFSGGSIAAAGTCTVSVDVTGPVGLYDNVSSAASHIVNAQTLTNGQTAQDSLQIDEPFAGIALRKQVGPGSDPDNDPWSEYLAVETGGDVFYKITVENTGEIPLTGLTVDDPDVDLSGCVWPDPLPVADLVGSHIATCVVGPVPAALGTHVNTASALADSTSGPVDDTDSATYATVELNMQKAATPMAYTTAGEDIDYTFTVTNDGDAILPGPVTITDPLVPGATCPSLSTVGNFDALFDPGESVVCTGTYTILAADVLNGSVTNTAYASAGGFDSPTDQVTVSVPPPTSADLVLTKSDAGSDPATLGGTVTYTILVTNNGPANALDVVVVDTLDADTTYVSDTGGCVEAPPGTLTCDLGDIAASASQPFTVTVNVSPTAPTAGTLSSGDCNGSEDLCNTASVSSATTEADPSDNEDSEPTDVEPEADLRIEKTGPATVVPGQDVIYTITVTNDGPSLAEDVVVADPTPSGLGFVSNAGDCVGAFPCNLGDIPVGEARVITATFSVPASYTTPDPVENTASVSSSTPDPDPSNDEDTASSGVDPSADVGVSKADAGTTVLQGGTVTYTIQVTNDGPSDATGVTVVDVLDPDTTYVSDTGGCVEAPPGTLTCAIGTLAASPGSTSFTVTVNVSATAPTAGTLENGSCNGSEDICNNVSVSADQDDPQSGNDTDSEPTDVEPQPGADLSIVKTGPATPVEQGAFVTYELTVTNGGPDAATNVHVVDTLDPNTTFFASSRPCVEGPPGTLDCDLGDLANGASATFTVVAHVDGAAPTGNGGSGTPCSGSEDLCNTAAVSSDTNDPDPSDDTTDVGTDVIAAASIAELTLSKTDVTAEPVAPGTDVTYEISVSNAGPATATDIVVHETLDPFMTYVSDTLPGGCTMTDPGDGVTTGPRLDCPLGDIAAAGTSTFQIVVTLSVSAPASSGQQDGDCTGTEDVCNDAAVSTTSSDAVIADNTDSEPTDVAVPVLCGNGSLNPGEQCDPPSGEICNNTIDDDGDLLIDCGDPNCMSPGFQSCDAACQLTQACVPILDDPARIKSNSVWLHGRFVPTTPVDPAADGFIFLLANEDGEILRWTLLPGDMMLRPYAGVGLKRWEFKDKTAKKGPGLRNGVYRVEVKERPEKDGTVSYPFRIRVYGDMSRAIHPTMTTLVYLGSDVGGLTAEWRGAPGRWSLSKKDADAGR